VGHGVGRRVVGAGAGGVAALVDRDGAVAGLGERGELGRPAPRRLGEPVEQQHHGRVLGAGAARPEREPADREVAVDGEVLDAGHAAGA
jgi:hypothetical protein